MAGEALSLDQKEREERQKRADALLAIDLDALGESTSEIRAFDVEMPKRKT